MSPETSKAEDFALVFIAPMDRPGTRLPCRPSCERAGHTRVDL